MPHSSFGTPCYRSGPALYYEVDHILCDDRNDHALHFHDCYELCFHIRGTQQLYFDQHLIDLQPLDVFIMQPYHIHGLVGPAQLDDHERLVIRLSPSALDKIGQGITSVRTTLDHIAKRCGGQLRLERYDWLVIRELLPMIKPDVADQTAVDKLIGLGALRIIVGIVLRASRVLPEAAVDSRRSDALLKSVADYIAANFNGGLHAGEARRALQHQQISPVAPLCRCIRREPVPVCAAVPRRLRQDAHPAGRAAAVGIRPVRLQRLLQLPARIHPPDRHVSHQMERRRAPSDSLMQFC